MNNPLDIDCLLDALTDSCLSLKQALRQRGLESTADIVESHQQAINTIIHTIFHSTCFFCGQEKVNDDMKPPSDCFPQRICRQCFEAIPHKRSKTLPWMQGTRLDRFYEREKQRDFRSTGIRYILQWKTGEVESNYHA